ncbi:MAG: flippase-like domain-containing protein [Defluviitaleaceae bacterium]|nr:flippase-like domain-containing protein [Defluviitaleaceae bacterium]
MNKKRVWMIIIAVLLLVALLQLDGVALWYSLRQIPLWLVLAMLVLQVAVQLLVNLQWFEITRLVGEKISFRDMFYINSQGALMDSITPGVKFGGEITRGVLISRFANCSGEKAAAMVVLQKMFSVGTLFFVLLFVASDFMGVFAYGAVVLLFLAFITIFAIPDKIKKWMDGRTTPRRKWAVKIRNFSLDLLTQIKSIRKNKKACILLALLSLFIWVFYPVRMYLIVLQFYPEANLVQIAVITFTAYMVAMLPIFPGGLGGFEATMSGFLVATGFAVSNAAVITIFFRFVTFWFVMLLGLAFIGVYKFIKRGSGNGKIY